MSQQHLSTHGNKKVKNLYCLPSKPILLYSKKISYVLWLLMSHAFPTTIITDTWSFHFIYFYLLFFLKRKNLISFNCLPTPHLLISLLSPCSSIPQGGIILILLGRQQPLAVSTFIWSQKLKTLNLCCQILYEMIIKFVYTGDRSATSGKKVSQWVMNFTLMVSHPCLAISIIFQDSGFGSSVCHVRIYVFVVFQNWIRGKRNLSKNNWSFNNSLIKLRFTNLYSFDRLQCEVSRWDERLCQR